MSKKWLGLAVVVGVAVVLVAPIPLHTRPYLMHITIVALFYAILASSWSLLAGYGGQFSFAHMALMGIGAYTAAMFGRYVRFATAPTKLCTELPVGGYWLIIQNAGGENCLEQAKPSMPAGTLIIQPSPVMGIVLGILMGALAGFLIGVLVLRLRRTYLALFTIAFAEILRTALNAEIDITGGPGGLSLVPLFPHGLRVFGFEFSPVDKVPPYYVMALLFLICLGLMYWLARSRFGLFLRTIREDEEAAAALGVHVVRYKVLVFTITSAIAAAAGAVVAHYIGLITPNIMVIKEMSIVIAMAVIGGLESLFAAALGAMIIEYALEFLRTDITLGSFTIHMTDWRLVFFGLLLMLTLRFWNNGLLYPLIQRITRAGVERETVAKRLAAAAERESEEAPEGATADSLTAESGP
ncbi:MAG: branched-chain amino acid ABC transporter permease [Chloroflexi bacterium]|nr:MAG: branched-chain amino acid ABC transporter permease [Chloroflexota bacterium]